MCSQGDLRIRKALANGCSPQNGEDALTEPFAIYTLIQKNVFYT
jgi:hypothetical protein